MIIERKASETRRAKKGIRKGMVDDRCGCCGKEEIQKWIACDHWDLCRTTIDT